jgi:hypothetical protein
VDSFDILPPLKEPFVVRIPVNGVMSTLLVDTGGSGGFLGTHYVHTHRTKHKRLNEPLPIQQAVKGSKPKCNAVATVNLKFGDHSEETEMFVNYDGILGFPTLEKGRAVIDVDKMVLRLPAWDVEIPMERWVHPATLTEKAKQILKTNAMGTRAEVGGYSDPPDISKQSRAFYRNKLLQDYDDIFLDRLPHKLPPFRAINHRIPVKIEKLWAAPHYRFPEKHKEALEKDLDLKLAAGIIVPTTDMPLATSHMVPKKDPGEMRHVQDLRPRNKDTETMVWPLPPTEEIIIKVAGCLEQSCVDLIQSFDQIRVADQDVPWTTFRMHKGVYYHLTMQMGDKNAVTTQQQMLETEKIRDEVAAYIDDIFPIGTAKTTPYEHYLTLLNEKTASCIPPCW